MLRAGITPWPKLLQNLRASFETDLLNNEYGEFGIHTIAEWLGHSPIVMLKHYKRIKKADYDKIAAACKNVKEKKTGKPTVSWNASLFTAEIGKTERHEAEIVSLTDSTQPLTNTALSGRKGNPGEPCGTPENPFIGARRT